MGDWQLNCLLYLHHLLFQSSYIAVGLRWGFIHLHHTDKWIYVILKDANNCMVLIVQ